MTECGLPQTRDPLRTPVERERPRHSLEAAAPAFG